MTYMRSKVVVDFLIAKKTAEKNQVTDDEQYDSHHFLKPKCFRMNFFNPKKAIHDDDGSVHQANIIR